MGVGGHVAIDIAGQRFGWLVAVSFTGRAVRTGRLWLCRCDCGGLVDVVVAKLRNASRTSCGCKRRNCEIVDGVVASAHPLHQTWGGMLARCYNPRTKAFKYYGGRGIAVCERWTASFALFVADMGPKPSPQHSIDRIDNSGNYDRANTRWATPSVQNGNRRSRAQAASEDMDFGQSAMIVANVQGTQWRGQDDIFLEASHLALEDLIEEFGAIDDSFDDRLFPFGFAS